MSSEIRETIDIPIDSKMIKTLAQLYIEARYPDEFGLLPDGKPVLNDAKELYESPRI